MDVSIEIHGLEEVQRKMEQVIADLAGPPMVQAMRNATLLVERDAKRYAPVDTGRLRASITPEVRTQGRTVMGVVGSNVKYAPFMELGAKPHWSPFGPGSALELWARRHGMQAFVMARAIARRGIEARRFLERAVRDNGDRIRDIINRAVGGIVAT